MDVAYSAFLNQACAFPELWEMFEPWNPVGLLGCVGFEGQQLGHWWLPPGRTIQGVLSAWTTWSFNVLYPKGGQQFILRLILVSSD